MLDKLVNGFILLVVGAVLGIGLTLWGQSLLSSHKETKAAKQTVVETVASVDKAGADEAVTDKQLAKNADNSVKIRDAVEDRISNFQFSQVRHDPNPNPTSANELQCAPAPVNLDTVLPFDVGTVRLLNAARTGTPIDSVTVSDAESRTPATVTIRIFVRNDTEIAKMYNDLAIRHNLLVDQVADFQKRQRERLAK